MAVALFPEQVLGKKGLANVTEILAGKKVVGIYFSAHWCPPCRRFTPNLAQFYDKVKDKGFEIIFASLDRKQEDFDGYCGEMPWYAIPFGDEAKEKLSETYEIRGIPALVLLNADGTIITKDGRRKVEGDPGANELSWLQ